METTIPTMNFWHAILTFLMVLGCAVAGFVLKRVENRCRRSTVQTTVRRNFDFFQY